MNESKEDFAPIEDLSKHLGVSVSTIRVWTRKKHIPEHTYLQVGSTYRYRINAVADALVKEKTTKQETIDVIDSIKVMNKTNVEQDADVMWEEEPVELSQAQIALAERLGIAPEDEDFDLVDKDI